jgi:hypothetical protein
MNTNAQFLGSARVPRVGLPLPEHVPSCKLQRKVRDREDALASTRDACAPQMP